MSRPKEKAVLGVVVLFAAVRLDVRRLQHRENCATRYQAAVPMTLSQAIPKVLLPPAFADLTLDYLPRVINCWIIFRLVLDTRSVCFPVGKASPGPHVCLNLSEVTNTRVVPKLPCDFRRTVVLQPRSGTRPVHRVVFRLRPSRPSAISRALVSRCAIQIRSILERH